MDREVVIVGAGPAGLQLAKHLKSQGLSYVVLERDQDVGAFFKHFPRHRKLISINKRYTGFEDPELNLRWDWNSLLDDEPQHRFTEYSDKYFPPADVMVDYLRDYRRRHDIEVKTEREVVKVSRSGARFKLSCANGEHYTCDVLVVATGLYQTNMPKFPGAEHVESYAAIPVDPAAFKDQRVLILGKGNSAFETAESMLETSAAIHLLSPSVVRMAWRTHYVGHLRAVNNGLLDTYQLKSQNTILDAKVDRIEREGSMLRVFFTYMHAGNQKWDFLVDRVIACTGFKGSFGLFDESVRPATCYEDKYPALTSSWESVNQKNLYFAGTLMHGRDYQKTFSGFIHGFRYNVRALSRILLSRRRGQAWKSSRSPLAPHSLVEHLLLAVHRNSALFQQPGYFCQAMVVDSKSESFQVFEDVPIEYLRDELLEQRAYATITMEYGHEDHVDPFAVERTPEDGTRSAFIHPVLRLYDSDGSVEEYHVPEDLENDWRKPMYLEPLTLWVQRHFAPWARAS
ncbi:MAG TPA: NAD(P)-binding domain-containing protein [Polyangiaceae bacterium]|nr:NAD(P)-binding domain-containing protein [Polyangiaceae bacterium]